MQFSRSAVALLASASLGAAAPSFKRQTSSQCVTAYDCPFEIMVAGCPSAQLTDGQVRVQNSSISEITDGQARCDLTGSTPTNFTLSNGQVTDSTGRVCEISNQNQFQCSATPDTGATTTGFSVCNGLLAFNSNSSFIACLATGDLPGYNIYTANVDRSTVTNCMPVQLDIPSCPVASTSSCVASTIISTETSTTTLPAETVQNTVTTTLPAETVQNTVTVTLPAQTVQTTVTATLPAQTIENTTTATLPAQTMTITATQPAQTSTVTATQPAQTVTTTATQPAQIVPAPSVVASTTTSSVQATCTKIDQSLGSSSFPNTISVVNENSDVSGSSYFAYIGSGNSTIFTFNPQSSGRQCSLNFLFPTNAEIVAQAGTTSYTLSSSSIAVTLYELDSVASVDDTFATKPARGQAYSLTLTPGSDSTFATFACPSSQTSYELTATDSNTLSFFEDYNPPPLGLTIGSCQ